MKQDRRRFLQNLGLLSAVGGVPAGLVSGSPGDSKAAPAVPAEAFIYFTEPEVAFVEATLDRLIPTDELGPGARAAGVAVFIDRELAGAFGTLARGYRSGPWPEGTPEQGYQSRLTPQEVYRVAIAETDGHCQERYGKRFAQLEGTEQDEVLNGLDAGTLALASVPSSLFFSLLWANVQEGFFADPLYGGNRDKAGWRLVGFPGVAAVYSEQIEQHGVPYRAEPVSIADLQAKRVQVDAHGHPVHTMASGQDRGR